MVIDVGRRIPLPSFWNSFTLQIVTFFELWSLADQIHWEATCQGWHWENHMPIRQKYIPMHSFFPYQSSPSQLLLQDLAKCSGDEAEIEGPSQTQIITPPPLLPIGRFLWFDENHFSALCPVSSPGEEGHDTFCALISNTLLSWGQKWLVLETTAVLSWPL